MCSIHIYINYEVKAQLSPRNINVKSDKFNSMSLFLVDNLKVPNLGICIW